MTGVVTCRIVPASASATHISYYSLLQPAFQHTSDSVGKLTARSPKAYKVSLANWFQNDSCTVYCDDLDGFYPRFYEPTDKGYAPALIFLGVGFCQGGRPAMRFLAVYSYTIRNSSSYVVISSDSTHSSLDVFWRRINCM